MHGIYMVYTWYIPVIRRPLQYVRHIPSKNLMCLQRIYILYQRYIIGKKGTEQTHEVFTRYIPEILKRTAYNWNIPCIYHVYSIYHAYTGQVLIYQLYTKNIHCIYHMVYPENIHCIYQVYLLYILSIYYINCIYHVYI